MTYRLTLVHCKWMILELFRQPAYLVSTVAFPSLFYVIFAVPESKSLDAANFLMASFAGFAFFGVVFLQFGVGFAQERSQIWYEYLRTLPVSPVSLLLARLFSSVVFASLAAGGIFALAVALTPMTLEISKWLFFLAVLFGGGLVFCVLGLALGFWTTEKTALPVGNLIYLPLSFVGGLWKPPEILPEGLKKISAVLPTRFYGNMLWASVKGESIDGRNFLGLGIYLAVGLLIALLGFQRDAKRKVRA